MKGTRKQEKKNENREGFETAASISSFLEDPLF